MSRFRYRDDDESSVGPALGVLVGAVAGFAVGVLVAQRVGGLSGLVSKLRAHDADAEGRAEAREDDEGFEDIGEDELETEAYDETLEERVLEAFKNDPVLSERAIDIGSIADGVIELAGWVEDEDESQHAVTIARGVPGVDTVVNRIALGDEERRFEEAARRVREGDSALTESRWEGRRVGTGRRRQGTSTDPDRHATPKVDLEDRWLRADDAIVNAAGETEGLAERRVRTKRTVRGDRTAGGAVAPSGVPKGDHVANPMQADTGEPGAAPQIERGDRF